MSKGRRHVRISLRMYNGFRLDTCERFTQLHAETTCENVANMIAKMSNDDIAAIVSHLKKLGR